MRRPIKTRKDLEIASDHFLRRNPGYPIGVTLTELDYLRGHLDDFFGDQLLDEYTTVVVGAGSSVSLVPGHGGWVWLRAGPANGRSAKLWLGDATDLWPTLDADYGYVIAVRMVINRTTNIQATIMVGNAASTRYIAYGIRTDMVANNWMIRTVDGVGGSNLDTGVATDTDPHWHVANVYPITGGRQIDYFLDGAPIGSKTTNMPNELLTPNLYCQNRNVAADCDMRVDTWDVIPRNL